MRVSGIIRDDGACGYYRISLPIITLSRRDDDFQCEIISAADDPQIVAQKLDADIVVIPRPNAESYLRKVATLKKLGKKVVIDHDDNVFSVSPLSPHYYDLGQAEYEFEWEDGQKQSVWKDGVNIDLKANRRRLEYMRHCMEQADAVSVTTEHLADVYRDYNDKVFVLPNCIDSKIWQAADIKKDKLRIGWHGGFSHYEDMYIVKDALREIMDRYSSLVIVLYGCKFDGLLKGIDKNRIEYHGWKETAAHPYKTVLLNIDIGMIPLADTEFNRCKSAIKWIEYGALGIPCVTSNVSPYKEVYDGKNGVFVDNETDAWVKGLSMLIEDRVLRADIGRRAKETVMRDFDINTQYYRWANAYRSLL